MVDTPPPNKDGFSCPLSSCLITAPTHHLLRSTDSDQCGRSLPKVAHSRPKPPFTDPSEAIKGPTLVFMTAYVRENVRREVTPGGSSKGLRLQPEPGSSL